MFSNLILSLCVVKILDILQVSIVTSITSCLNFRLLLQLSRVFRNQVSNNRSLLLFQLLQISCILFCNLLKLRAKIRESFLVRTLDICNKCGMVCFFILKIFEVSSINGLQLILLLLKARRKCCSISVTFVNQLLCTFSK